MPLLLTMTTLPYSPAFCSTNLTQIDCTKNAQSGLYQIINSSDVVDSTADLRDVTDAGKSLSSLGYWNNTTVGAGSYYDDYTGMYSDPGYPVFPYGA